MRVNNYDTKKIKLFVLIVTFIMIVILLLVFTLQPIRLPEPIIRHTILQETPLGSNKEEVLYFISENEDWLLIQNRGGPIIHRAHPITREDFAMTIGVRKGFYTGFLFMRTDVSIYWRFDDDGYLYDVVVRKELDVL